MSIMVARIDKRKIVMKKKNHSQFVEAENVYCVL